ncbi:MAG: hypothetical protein AB8B85_04435, partial [Paracoccaceae bacterium]
MRAPTSLFLIFASIFASPSPVVAESFKEKLNVIREANAAIHCYAYALAYFSGPNKDRFAFPDFELVVNLTKASIEVANDPKLHAFLLSNLSFVDDLRMKDRFSESRVS